jgi:hypothetical protein
MISLTVVPAQAGTQFRSHEVPWTPAYAGVTKESRSSEE